MAPLSPTPSQQPDISPFASPSVQLPWMRALIHADAKLAAQDEGMDDLACAARDAVYYIRCGLGPDAASAGIDFLTAVGRARKLVAQGARRIVFLTSGDTPDGQLQKSLLSFSHHVRRALCVHQAEFTVVPLHATHQTRTPAADPAFAR